MKLLFDFLPLIFFFATYKIAGLHADAAASLATQWMGGWVSGGGHARMTSHVKSRSRIAA